MQFCKKPVVVEAITFSEFIQHGLENTTNVVNGMPWSFEYKGHPITHENDQCYLIPSLEGTMFFTPDDMLITGVKGEIYPCKRDVFDSTYELAEGDFGASFGRAIEALKNGKRVARSGWNGKGMWLSMSGHHERTIPANAFWSQNNRNFAEQNGGEATVLPCITMKTADDKILMGWLASQSDMLAEDWIIDPC